MLGKEHLSFGVPGISILSYILLFVVGFLGKLEWAWPSSGIRQATINCNSKSLKLQQITGGKLTAKQLRCRHRRSRRSSREMSTCGSRRCQQLLPLHPLRPGVRSPELSFPFIVIFSANFRCFSSFFIYFFLPFWSLALSVCFALCRSQQKQLSK